MELLADIGNSNIKLCTYNGEYSCPEIIPNEQIGSAFKSAAGKASLSCGECRIVSVNDAVLDEVRGISDGAGLKTSVFEKNLLPEFKTRYKNPGLLGNDRVVTDFGGYSIYGGGLIIIDLGTAATFDIIDENGEHLGGAIMPGLQTYQYSLLKKAAVLPPAGLKIAPCPVGTTTGENLEAGIYYGFIGSILHMNKTLKEKKEFSGYRTVLTGGDTELFAGSDEIDIFDRSLTLKGLHIIMNRGE